MWYMVNASTQVRTKLTHESLQGRLPWPGLAHRRMSKVCAHLHFQASELLIPQHGYVKHSTVTSSKVSLAENMSDESCAPLLSPCAWTCSPFFFFIQCDLRSLLLVRNLVLQAALNAAGPFVRAYSVRCGGAWSGCRAPPASFLPYSKGAIPSQGQGRRALFFVGEESFHPIEARPALKRYLHSWKRGVEQWRPRCDHVIIHVNGWAEVTSIRRPSSRQYVRGWSLIR
jgi:hypothetical protein